MANEEIYSTLFGMISGAIIGAIGSIFATRELYKRERHKVFIEAFIPVLAKLEDSIDDTPGFTYDVLVDAYPCCFNAYIGYRCILDKVGSETLAKKWEYYSKDEERKSEDILPEKRFIRFGKYMPYMGKIEGEKSVRLLAIKDIKSLIEMH